MKTSQVITLGALCCALVTVAPAENLRRVAEANTRGFAHAMKTKDIGWFKKVAAPDFYEESKGKKTKRDQALANMSQLFSMGTITDISTKILKVTPQGNGMIAHVSVHVVMMCQFPGAKKRSKMVGDSLYDEKWSKDHGKWMVHWLKTLKDTGTIDGKPMPPDM